MSEDTPWAPASPWPGSRLAGYLLEDEIGRGGMAVVYRAYDDRLGRRVALKVLAPELARDEAFRKRFIREARAAASVDHPHIVPVFDAGEADGILYLAMRYVPGGDVRMLLDRASPLPVARACALIGQVAAALDAAHARGLVHRDIKPTNMLLDVPAGSGQPDHLYLSDFGLAKPVMATSGLTMAGQFFGTADYVAPEQIQGSPVDGRADQYSLACASYEMLCGEPPFRREHAMAVLSAQLSEEPPSLAGRRLELPAAADAALARALAKAPHDRYPRCQDFAEALLAACGLAGTSARAAGAQEAAGVPFPRTPGRPAPSGSPAGLTRPVVPPQQPPSGPGTGGPGWYPPLAGAAAPPGPGDGRPGRDGHPRYPDGGPPRRRGRAAVTFAVVVAVLALAGLAALLRHRHLAATAGGSPAPVSTSVAGPGAAPPSLLSPAATVQAYVRAINSREYRRAWALGGRNATTSYRAFVTGFHGTVYDRLRILSVTGDLVRARIFAQQSDGSVRVFQGVYRVAGGVITRFRVIRLS